MYAWIPFQNTLFSDWKYIGQYAKTLHQNPQINYIRIKLTHQHDNMLKSRANSYILKNTIVDWSYYK